MDPLSLDSSLIKIMDFPPRDYRYNGEQDVEQRKPLLQMAAKKSAAAPSVPATATIPRVDSKRIIAKQSRPRKRISEFRRKGRDYSTWRGRIGVHIPIDEIDIAALSRVILETLPGWELEDEYDCLRLSQLHAESYASDTALTDDETGSPIKQSSSFDAAMPEVFVFSFGAVVFWNFVDAKQEEEWMATYLLCRLDVCGVLHNVAAAEEASDEIAFVYGDASSFRMDVVVLFTRDSGEKLAVSFALAKSSLLSIYEWRLQRTIERNSHIPEELAKNGKIAMTREEISQEIGQIFLVKHGINLDSSLVDTPEEFWEDDQFESIYQQAMKYFEISKRLELVNNRLSMLQDLHVVLIEAVENHHAVYLEWIIILLIVVEVLLDLFHLTMF